MERSFYPLICMACGKRGAVSPEGLAKAASGSHSLRCKCGSDDIDLDTTPDAMQVSASPKTAAVIPNGTPVHCRTDVFGSEPFEGVVAGGNYFGDLPEPTSYTVRRSVADELAGLGGSTTVNPDDLTVVASKTAEQKSYKPFCSLECNREYSSTVAAPDTANNTEPYCLNCGKPTEEMPKRSSRKQAERTPEGSIVNAVMQWTYDDAEYRYGQGRISQEEFDAYTWLWANGAVRFGHGPGMSYRGLPLADLYPEAREIIEGWAADPAGGRVRDILSRVGTTASRKQAAVEVTVNPRRPSERVVTIVRQVGPGLYETDSGERVNYDNVQSRDMDALLGAFPEVWHNDTYPIEPVDGQGELHFASREAIAREILRTNPGLNPRLVERVASKTLARLQEKG